MKKTDLAYVAGIVDGEGCIGIQSFKSKGHRGGLRYEMYVAVSNTNEWLIQWLKFSFGGSFCLLSRSGLNNKDCWSWRIQTRQAANFLRLIQPYLRLKAPQAELALSFQSGKRPAHTHIRKPKTDKELAIEEAQSIMMHKFNKKGIL